jgi:hypothetical protein
MAKALPRGDAAQPVGRFHQDNRWGFYVSLNPEAQAALTAVSSEVTKQESQRTLQAVEKTRQSKQRTLRRLVYGGAVLPALWVMRSDQAISWQVVVLIGVVFGAPSAMEALPDLIKSLMSLKARGARSADKSLPEETDQ